ncbi:MAG: hypothetical protein ACE5QF_02775 [Thermoplasmata archaeon]
MSSGLKDNASISLSTNMLVMAVVAAISIPMVFSAFETYDRLRVENDLLSEISRFVSISLVYFDAGGGQTHITIRLQDGVVQHLDFVEFGGPPDSSLSASIRYRFQGEDVVHYLLDEYRLRMTAGDDALKLTSGTWTIRIEVMGGYLHLSLA